MAYLNHADELAWRRAAYARKADEKRAYQRAQYAKHAEKRRAARKARYWKNADFERSSANTRMKSTASYKQRRLQRLDDRWALWARQLKEEQKCRTSGKCSVTNLKVNHSVHCALSLRAS